MQKKEYSVEIGGRTLTATFSDLAGQASGSVLVKYGETLILATAVMSASTKDDLDYFPLSVEYEEKFYAAGKILGGRFIKREGKPSDEAVLSGRIVDRTIRPLFDDYIRNEVQVIITILSIDEDNDPDVPAVIGASLALATSDIPWHGPVGAIRLGPGATAGTFAINPSYKERLDCDFDLLICGKEGKIGMIEAEGKEIPEATMIAAFNLATEELSKIQAFQENIVKEIGKEKKVIEKPVLAPELTSLFKEAIESKLEAAVFGNQKKGAVYDLRDEWLALAKEKIENLKVADAIRLYEETVNDIVHKEAIEKERRVDGRALTEIRSLFAQAGGLSKVVHGAGFFYRGETHVLTVLTLGGPKDSQILEGMEIQDRKYFMHHYNFPPFSVGETGRVGGTNRRSVGHGALAEKSLRAIIPSRDVFPYTIRLVSEVLSSNGSSSMGSVCGSTLALMDGGVPIKAPVAGIAMGLMSDEEGRYKILTDIQGPEDHYGDMDFKVAGTKDGITGIQLDIKVGGIDPKILAEAMERAKAARLQILETIEKAIPAPRPEIADAAPTIVKLMIPVDKIGAVIGSGGKVIQKISADSGAEIEIEDDGTVYISGKKEGVALAKQIVEDLTREYLPGDRFMGEVVKITDFGAFVKVGVNTEGLVHISEMAPFRLEKVTDLVQVGEKVPVVVREIDDRGRLSLSIKSADPEFAAKKGVVPKNLGNNREAPRS